jgi:pyruvate kinase
VQRERPAAVLSSDDERRTAIVVTLGPASESRSRIEDLVRAGLDIVRLSMSNGSQQWHGAMARQVRDVAAGLGRHVRVLADLQARKNRLGDLPGGRADWAPGDEVVLSAAPGKFSSHRTWTSYPWAPAGVRPGIAVLIDDGAVVLKVTDAAAGRLRCVVTQGGVVTSGRGVAIPGARIAAQGLTDRDVDDLRFARDLGVDLVALSFAASARDYDDVNALAPDQLIIGKVEHPSALAALPAIAAAFDGLMVARGDLAVEIPFEEVPFAQKRVLAECAGQGKVSMVATQLLHSMRESTLPTRAEVSDIANAVLDGADALVLTGETGYGRNPVEVVEVLRKVIIAAERHAGQTAREPRRVMSPALRAESRTELPDAR